jgi:phospholipase/lecithinase/hemolysin
MKIAFRSACPIRTLPFAALAMLLTWLTPATHLLANNNGKGQDKPSFTGITVIGDSLSDTGRTFQAIGIPPFPYYQGRVSNGPVWVEYLAPSLGLNYNPLDNFSWAGARTDRSNSFTGLPGMLDELDELLSTSKRLDNQALYVVFGGSNDFIRIFAGEDPMVVISEAVGNILSIVTQLRARGAKHIVVVDLPNLGLTPRVRAGGPALALTVTFLSTVYNELLNTALDSADKKIVRVSAFNILNMLAANPAAFGLTNVTDQGISIFPAPADTYLFWDDIHPSTTVHRILAETIYEAVEAAGMLKRTANPTRVN